MQKFKIGIGVSLTSLLAIAFATAATGVGCSTGSGTGGTAGATGAAGSAAGTTGSAAGTTGAAGSTASAGTTGAAGTTDTGAAGTTGTASGGTTGAAGATTLPVTTGVCAGEGTRAAADTMAAVDDFEAATLSQGWSTFNDITGAPNSIMMTQEAGGAVATAHYGHYAGMGAKTPAMGGYGVGAIFNVAIDKTAGVYCIDVTGFDGLTFWAKAAKDLTKVGVNFVIPETNAVADGGDCPPVPAGKCYLHPQKTVTLSTAWKQYSIPFSAAIGGTAKIQGRIQELGWLSPDSDWDFSIDEIQFYKGTPPTTAVASP